MREACQTALPRSKRPGEFRLVQELPLGPTGKISRRRLRELAFLNSGLSIELRDERHTPEQAAKFCYEGGVAEFAIWLDRAKTSVLAAPITALPVSCDALNFGLI